METRAFDLGAALASDGAGDPETFNLPSHHLVTHGCILGMTGSGKTGLAMVLVEETLRSRIPVLVVDVQGDLPHLLLTLPPNAGFPYTLWIVPAAAAQQDRSPLELGTAIAAARRASLADW